MEGVILFIVNCGAHQLQTFLLKKNQLIVLKIMKKSFTFKVQSPSECSVKWRRSLRSGSEGSCRLLEKRGGVIFNEGVRISVIII